LSSFMRSGMDSANREIASNFYGCFCPKMPNFAGVGAAKAATHGMKVLRTGTFSPEGASM
jgi:hypothetical protein